MLKFSVHTEGMDAIKDKLTEGCTKAEHTVALQVRKDTSPYVPMLTGSLDKRTRVEGAEVIYPGPYARYLYFGKLMVDPAILTKLAIDFADGVIQGSETINQEVLDYISAKKDTPFLPYQSPETYMDEFNKFYDVVLDSNTK